MPLYEFQCEKCGRRMEVILQRFSAPHPKKCEHCGGKLKKLMSSPAVQFKGSGWYVSDYAKAGSDKEVKGKEEKGTEKKEEGKPAEKGAGDAAAAGADASKGADAKSTKETDSSKGSEGKGGKESGSAPAKEKTKDSLKKKKTGS